ncbi:MAG: lipid A biosynthesis acyltransferase [Candidatus Adiutrix sp.]|jgi:predicted LPLAT superfamily acyltransferase|nr:lipid A biosynthesis acyltransferase [Candidatus Adiutrix sp.]
MAGENWSSRSLGSRFQHQVFYWLIRRVGLWAAYLLLYPVVGYYTLKILAGQGFYPYLARRFPEAGRLRQLANAFLLNLAFGRVLVDRADLGLTRRIGLEAEPEAAAILNGLLAEGRGLVLLTAHVGAWQAGLTYLWRLDRPINVVLWRQEADLDRHYFEHDIAAAAPRFLDAAEPGPALAAAAAALLRGEVVALTTDRVRPGETWRLRAPFLGGEIGLPGGPFYLAARLGAPVAVVFTWRSGPGLVNGGIFKIVRPARVSDPRSEPELQPLAEAFTGALTDFVSEHPFQFFNFHDLWSG